MTTIAEQLAHALQLIDHAPTQMIEWYEGMAIGMATMAMQIDLMTIGAFTDYTQLCMAHAQRAKQKAGTVI